MFSLRWMVRAGKILITGSGGQLGQDLVRILRPDHEIVGFDLPEFDICDRSAVGACFARHKPSTVIHAAAYTDVDGCESNINLAMRVNEEGTRNVARACQESGARLIYFSTDYVFDGNKSTAYVESDQPAPKTIYGQSKLAGEKAVESILEDYLIMRIAWVYGAHGKNFVKMMLKLGAEQLAAKATDQPVMPLMVVNDQRGNPTWTVDIVNQTNALLEAEVTGIVHATSVGETSWFDFALEIFKLRQMDVRLSPCDSSQFPRPAKRPSNSALENGRLKQLGCHRLRPYLESLEEFLATYEDEPK